ncbi:cyclic pyranopterin monophosphate synthase [Desulfovibrionales bacterium]
MFKSTKSTKTDNEPILLLHEVTKAPELEPTTLSHVSADGQITMVDVGDKASTSRLAVAQGVICMSAATLELLERQALAKGDALTTARIAGIIAAKRTWELIPLCHQLSLNQVIIEFNILRDTPAVRVTAKVRNTCQTGVEMEALTAVSVTLLTLYDMCKAVQKDLELRDIYLLHKSGGRSGLYKRKK